MSRFKSEHLHKTIVFFDGYCNLCNRSVDFLIRNDKRRKIYYASQQSEFAKFFFENLHFDATNAESIILFYQGKFYLKSTAFLILMRLLGFPFNSMVVFYIFPKFLRNLVYDFIAKNRYQWFGKKATCRIPTTQEKEFFLE